LRQELKAYSEDLINKKEVLIGTKLDEIGAVENFEKFKAKYSDKQVFGMTILDEKTIEPIMDAFVNMIEVPQTEEKSFTSSPDTDAFYSDVDTLHPETDD